MALKFLLRDFLRKNETWHFSRIDLGPPERRNLHSHDFPELFWVESGRGVHWIHGEKRPLAPGMLVFILPKDVHTLGSLSGRDPMVICNLAFATSRWRTVQRRFFKQGEPWFRGGNPALREHALGPRPLEFLRQAGQEMLTAPRSALRLERFFLNLAVVLEKAQATPGEGAPGWLEEALERIEREGLFREGPSALIRLAGRSQEHVVRETRRWFQRTPTALVNAMRMRHAARCLASTRMEIVDVCYDCGLENLGHFYALFQEFHGVTPRRFRLMSQAIVRAGS